MSGSGRGRPVPGRAWRASVLAEVALACGALPTPAGAQLISPGRLSSVHAELEGVRNCVRCHQLRTPGVSPTLCLDCHRPLAARIEADSGFHATLAEEDCAACHKEHLGTDYVLVRFDTLDFDHARSGWALDGAHVETGCRACHDPAWIVDPLVVEDGGASLALERTFLGLGTECVGCHAADDPHGGQFAARACTDCHDTGTWEEAPGFDHDSARYRLTGRHRQVACGDCHATERRGGADVVRYRPVTATTCASCHDDPHAGAMEGACTDCHETGGWLNVRVERVEGHFDHASTGFALEGSHGRAQCSSCHEPERASSLPGIAMAWDPGTVRAAFPRPRVDGCATCHVDEHDGAFDERPDGPACDGCHDQERWVPAHYGLERHDREAAFLLEGAHRAVACSTCHRPDGDALVLRPEAGECASCHAPDDPHGEQFTGRECAECHSVDTFRIPRFDHDRTRYPLDGAHRDAACAACHVEETGLDGVTRVRWRPLGTRCRDCHGGDGGDG